MRGVNPETRTDPLVEMTNIHVAYGEYVVFNGLNWTVRRGENWAVVGPNGSGKSTLLSLITGITCRSTPMRFTFSGRDGARGEHLEIRRRIGVVSPELQLRYRKPVRVRDVVLSGFFDSIGLYRRPDREQEAIADRWLETLGMADRADRLFTRTSYGEKRLALIARAMVKSPELLILDEPCQGLDSANRERVLALMERIGERTETGLIYITHHEEEMIPCIGHILKLEKKRRTVTNADPVPEAPGMTLRKKAADIVRREGKAGEQPRLQRLRLLPEEEDRPFPLRLPAVLFEDVPHPLAQRHDPVVEDPLVRIVDDLRLGRDRGGEIAVQADMLADDTPHLRVADFQQQLRPRLGMVFQGLEAPGLRDIVEERRGPDQIPVQTIRFQMIDDQQGDPADLPGMGHDIVQHPHPGDQPPAFRLGRDLDPLFIHRVLHNRSAAGWQSGFQRHAPDHFPFVPTCGF